MRPATIAALVQTGEQNVPALASRLHKAAEILRTNSPRKVNVPSARLWHVPSESRAGVVYLVDRLDRSCTCPDYRQYCNWRSSGRHNTNPRGAPSGWCKHRLAVEMICRLRCEPEPEPAPDPRPAPGLAWQRGSLSVEAAQAGEMALLR